VRNRAYVAGWISTPERGGRFQMVGAISNFGENAALQAAISRRTPRRRMGARCPREAGEPRLGLERSDVLAPWSGRGWEK